MSTHSPAYEQPAPPPGPQPAPCRHYEHDWLRALVILNLIPFHATWLMILFPEFPGFSRGSDSWWASLYYLSLFSYFHMPLLFFLAGFSAATSLDRRSARDYLAERAKRLLVPLAFFMVFLYPLMVYHLPGAAEERSVSHYLLSFWLPCLRAFHHNWPGDSIPALPSWGHLWFVAYLLVISVAALPLLLWLKRIEAEWRSGGTRWAVWAQGMEARSWWFVLPATLFAAIVFLMAPQWSLFRQHDLVGNWTYFTCGFAAFLLGCSVGRRDGLRQVLARRCLVLLPVAATSAVLVIWLGFHVPAYSKAAYTPRYLAYATLFGLNTWLWIMTALGLANRYLSHSNAFLGYASRASYPWYILHMVPMPVIGFYVTQWGLGNAAELLLIAVLMFAATLILYELVVKRAPITRLLFGMKG